MHLAVSRPLHQGQDLEYYFLPVAWRCNVKPGRGVYPEMASCSREEERPVLFDEVVCDMEMENFNVVCNGENGYTHWFASGKFKRSSLGQHLVARLVATNR